MYFGNEYLQDAIYEQTNLNEMHISKKDLEDPKILEKVLKETEKDFEKNGCKFLTLTSLLSIASSILLGIGTGSIIIGVVAFLPCFAMIADIVGKYMPITQSKITHDNLKKLISKIENVLKKAQKLKDTEEKKKIISKYEKLLKDVKDKYNELFEGKNDNEIRYMESDKWYNEHPELKQNLKKYYADKDSKKKK